MYTQNINTTPGLTIDGRSSYVVLALAALGAGVALSGLITIGFTVRDMIDVKLNRNSRKED